MLDDGAGGRARKRGRLLARSFLAASLAAVLPGGILAPAAAAEPGGQEFLGPPQPGRERPLPDQAPPAKLDFTIEAPRRSPVPRAAEDLTFDLKDVVLQGGTVYPPAALRPLVEPVLGRTIHLSDLLSVAEAIEAKYRDDGYVLTRVYVPTQTVSDGIFQIGIIEGYVAALSVEGGTEAVRARVERLAEPVLASRPLKLPVIEKALLAANTLPGVSVSGLLRPSATERGASDLVVTVKGEPYSILFSSDNRGSKINGLWTNSVDLAVASPFEDGGQLLLNASAAPDFDQRRSFRGRYTVALGEAGTTISLGGIVSHGQPGGVLADAKVVSDSIAIGPRLSQPLLLARQEKLILEGGLTWQSADVEVIGMPFSHDEWRVLDVNLSYQNSRFLDGVTNATFGVAQGLAAFGASSRFPDSPTATSTSRYGARPDFTKFSLLLGHRRPLVGPLGLSVAGIGQYARDTLLSGEQISFGGTSIGRGYDPAAISGDHGLGGSVELTFDVDAVPLHMERVQLYSFYDAAKVWWKDDTTGHATLASAGFGVRTMVLDNLSLGGEFAYALIPVAASGDGRRGSRVLFNGAVKF